MRFAFAILLLSLAAPAAEPAPVLISARRLKTLHERVSKKMEPTWTAYLKLKEYADKQLERNSSVPQEWHVPGYYSDAEGHAKAKQALQDDANCAYQLALCWKMSGDERYATAAARLIDGWCGLKKLRTENDSRLSFSYHFPAMIFAAAMLRDFPGWPAERQEIFAEFLRKKALPMSTIDGSNNWGNWGLVLSVSCAAYLQDDELLKRCAVRWKEFIAEQIAEDGHLPKEVRRGRHGVWYTHFCLMPQTLAADILRVNGIDLFAYQAPNGRTLRAAYERVVPWAADPATFPYYKGDAKELYATDYISYFEILNARWPGAQATALLKERRPLTANHSAPVLTFTHGELLEE